MSFFVTTLLLFFYDSLVEIRCLIMFLLLLFKCLLWTLVTLLNIKIELKTYKNDFVGDRRSLAVLHDPMGGYKEI